MKATFNIGYRTQWGEHLCISGDIPALGAGCVQKAAPMRYRGDGLWQLELELPDSTPDFGYRYIVVNDNGSVRHEWGKAHHFERGFNIRTFIINDRWQDQPQDKPYYSTVFTDCICRRGHVDHPAPLTAGRVRVSVDAPMIAPDCSLAISGGCDALGNWDTSRLLIMDGSRYPTWSIDIDSALLPGQVEYKFVIVKTADRSIVAWEARDNRTLRIADAPVRDAAVIFGGLRLANPLAPWHGAGTAIPVFALRTDDDFGVGDFMDLCKMADWAADTGQRILQLLPINDTTMTHTWTDSYPYNANSTFALHPMYLSLKAMGELQSPERRRHYEDLRQELNALPTVDYERVNNAKTAYTRELFAQGDGARTLKSKEFKDFFARNAHWLTPYAAFCVLRDINGTPDMSKWGDMAVYDADRVTRFVGSHRGEIEFVYFQQYHLDRQMRHAIEYAHSRGVAIKGDIPIGISRTSVDAWQQPRLFNLNSQAGAPPDDFSVMGQNWGFPTYNWEEMCRDGFAWWKARFGKMAENFDAYRIDHVLGFFRIWQIPMDAIHGLLGVFNPALPFTPEELRHNYDFWINPDRQARPYIMDWFLGDYFGEHTDEARSRFLISEGDGHYRLRPGFDTQRKVAEYFASQPVDDKNKRLADGLMGLIDNVLFIEDPYEKGKYHPRIAAQYTYAYRALTDYERWCYNRLYNDFFYRRHNDFWYGKAMWKLPPLIDSNNMLCCAEDLGMIPDCVPAVMGALEIQSLEIQRMPKDPHRMFGDTWQYPYYSVCTTSTHDMGGIRLWWEEDRAKSQRYYNEVLQQSGDAPYFAEPWLCEKILELHVKSPSMLCIIPLQDWLSMDSSLRRENPADEVINVPANPRHYWRYRMHLTVEQLSAATMFNTRLRDLIASSGR